MFGKSSKRLRTFQAQHPGIFERPQPLLKGANQNFKMITLKQICKVYLLNYYKEFLDAIEKLQNKSLLLLELIQIIDEVYKQLLTICEVHQ